MREKRKAKGQRDPSSTTSLSDVCSKCALTSRRCTAPEAFPRRTIRSTAQSTAPRATNIQAEAAWSSTAGTRRRKMWWL
jgi:hypothetical protein